VPTKYSLKLDQSDVIFFHKEGRMIPGKILAFLENEGTVAVGGTRDQNLIPHIHYVSGWSVEPDKRTIRCSIADAYKDHLISSLEDNGHFALTIEQIGSHETYQFKGDYVSSASLTDTDIAAHERIKQLFAKVVNQIFGFGEGICGAYILRPAFVIRFSVREIFLQTPGPGAGQRLFPHEEK
jgi:hypothetical protein